MEKFEVWKVKGEKVLFTPSRFCYVKEDILESLELYEVRGSDEGFEPCEIARGIMVNHYGSLMSFNPIYLADDNRLYIDESKDIEYLDEMLTIDEYIQSMQPAINMEMKM